MPSQTDIIKQRKQRNMERTESESEIVQVPHLDYMEQTHTTQVLSQLHQMHRRDQFCDAKLIVGDHETCIHRAVLASASSFFFKMFEKGVEDDKNQAMFKLKDVGWDEFKYLLDYIYTGRLDVPDNKVKAVYRLSQDLRIHSATRVCVAYLTSCLTPDNCLGIRTFAADEAFKREINMYISDNIRDVTCSKKFYGLTRISLEIVVPSEHQINMANHEEILPEVLRCLKQKIEASKNKVEPLTEDMMVMYLNSDNSLTDCNDVDDATVQENEVVQDYKKLTKKKMSGFTPSKDQSTSTLSPEANGTSNYRKFSIEPSTSRPNYEQESSIVASYKTKDRSYMVIAMLNSNLVTISIHYRPAVSSGSGTEDPDSPVNSNSVHSMFNGSPEEQLASMSTNRCAFGLKVLNDKLFACGGYDRGECLKSVEMYDIKTNKWTAVSDMKSARGRFSIGLYKNKVYACGGSSGNHDMKTVECYDPETDKWQVVCDAPRGKASPGIAVVQGKLYVIGGCIGQTTSSSCETLDLETNEWKSIAPMRIPRFQEAVVVFRNKIYVIGGTNGWKCLNEVEVYDPQTDEWTNAPGLNIGRRGAGVEVFNGKIYLVGGNDGQSALNSVEVYDPETHTWSVGPTLSCHRANCGVAILDDRMFAVGGFNGKKFLNSVESLDMKELDFWNICVPNSDVLEVTLDENSTDSEVGANGDMCTQNDDVSCLCGDGPKVVKKKLGLVISENNGAALTDTTDIAGKATCNGGGSIKVDSERPS